MIGPDKRPAAEPSTVTVATPPASSGEGAQTALLALIKKRKLSGDPEADGEVPDPPPETASDT